MALLCLACSEAETAAHDAGAPDAGPPALLSIRAPSEGQVLFRDRLAVDGAFYARVEFRALASAEVATMSWRSGGAVLGEGRELPVGYLAADDGEHRVMAIAHDAQGTEIARATVMFSVKEAPLTDCPGWLSRLGVAFRSGPDTPGIRTPVTVSLPLHGMAFRYVERQAPRTEWLMDCELALRLYRAAELMATYGVVEVADIGLYNYRCIDQSVDPPDCPGSRLSQHAQAMAIDIAGLTVADGTYASVLYDWVLDPEGATCAAPTESSSDALLHAIVCDLYAHDVFSYYLTPNYNDIHRNHWHLDLTPDGKFLRSAFGVDRGEDDE
jgi:hypothetical protein